MQSAFEPIPKVDAAGAFADELTSVRGELTSARSELASVRDELARATDALAGLRVRYRQLLEELSLLKRRLYVAKAERLEDVAEAQLAFDKLVAEAEAVERVLDATEGATSSPTPPAAPPPDPTGRPRKKPATKPRGRRSVDEFDLPVVRIELVDPDLEGKFERIGFDESSHVGQERGGPRRIVWARVVYKNAVQHKTSEAPNDQQRTARAPDETRYEIRVAHMPKEIIPRGLLAPSMIAHILAMKYVLGVPFHRYEQQTEREGFKIDRGMMSRYSEHVGATLGCIVEAARKEAIASAFCIATDATGVAIQPTRIEGKRQVCRKGHFFVSLADKDHVFLDFQAKHTSLTVWEMFKGYSGYVQADAHAIYDALFKGIAPEGAAEAGGEHPPPIEVGCFSHARRKYWEAAACKHPLGLEGLRRIDAIFAADRELAKLAPAVRKARRDVQVKPLVDAFFEWAGTEHRKLVGRGLVATALGYSIRHEAALRRFLDDGRLRMENNAAERALRTIAVGRKAWLFYGSDDHASAAGNLLSLIASCKLHDLDPEAYLCDMVKVVLYWPRDRYIELAPKYWKATRARIDPRELDRDVALITVPPPLPVSKKQTSAN